MGKEATINNSPHQTCLVTLDDINLQTGVVIRVNHSKANSTVYLITDLCTFRQTKACPLSRANQTYEYLLLRNLDSDLQTKIITSTDTEQLRKTVASCSFESAYFERHTSVHNLINKQLPNKIPIQRDIRDVDLTDCILINASLNKADFRRSNLTGATMIDASLTSAQMSEANLTDATLTNADLSEATLTNAIMIGTNLINANLTAADLSGANLSKATLLGANLTGTNLKDCNLDGANLTGQEGHPDIVLYYKKKFKHPFNGDKLNRLNSIFTAKITAKLIAYVKKMSTIDIDKAIHVFRQLELVARPTSAIGRPKERISGLMTALLEPSKCELSNLVPRINASLLNPLSFLASRSTVCGRGLVRSLTTKMEWPL